MPYQENHVIDGLGKDNQPASSAPGGMAADRSSTRTILLIIGAGLVAAIVLAIFG